MYKSVTYNKRNASMEQVNSEWKWEESVATTTSYEHWTHIWRPRRQVLPLWCECCQHHSWLIFIENTHSQSQRHVASQPISVYKQSKRGDEKNKFYVISI